MNIQNTFNDFRKQGFRPVEAIRAARILQKWEPLESEGFVKLEWHPDSDPYDDSFIDTWTDENENTREQYRKALWRDIERDGVWGLVASIRTDTDDSEAWEVVDSIWGLVGQDDAGYGPDLMNAAIQELDKKRKTQN